MHKPESSPRSAGIAFLGNLDSQKNNLVTTLQKFQSKINIVEKCTAQVGHLVRKEQHLHCFTKTSYIQGISREQQVPAISCSGQECE